MLKNNKSLGQNWLKNREILDTIASLAETPGVSTCLEIGPGLGTLTSSLLRRFEKVIAVEFDHQLAVNLPKSFPGKTEQLQIVEGDILTVDFSKLLPEQTPFVVAGNIPYYITSPIIKKLLTDPRKPQKIVLLIQKEVAERIAADAGHHTLLSLFVQNFAEVTLGPIVPRTEFTPPPKVDSQVIILEPYDEPVIEPSALDFAKLGFSAPRKKLTANLSATTGKSKDFWQQALTENAISPDSRPGDLSLYDWQTLASVL